jgi:hypothetical protein
MEGMLTLAIVAGAFFMAMFLMRWTLRQSQRGRPDGVRWRGIDWTGVKVPEKPASEQTESSPDKEASPAPPTSSS